MPLFDPFTERITTTQHQGKNYAVLHRNGSCVAFDQIVHYDEANGLLGCVPCNVLIESDSESDYLKDPLLWAQGGIIQIPNLIVGGGSMGGIAGQSGLTFNLNYSEGGDWDLSFEHERLGHTSASIEQRGASDIQLGFNSLPVVDDGGLSWGVTINIINDNIIELPEWDLFLDVDTYLANAYATCEDTQYGLSTYKHCAVCERRAKTKRMKESAKLTECLSDSCENGSNFLGSRSTDSLIESYSDYSSICYGSDLTPAEQSACYDYDDTWLYDHYDRLCQNEYVKVYDDCGCICAEEGTVTTWAPYKNFTPLEDWPDNWNQATITNTSCISKAGDRSRHYCRYVLSTTMFGQQVFDSTKESAIGQTQQAGLQVQGSGGTLELSAEGYNDGEHSNLRILGVHIALVGENGSIDSSDGAFDGSISVNTDPTNGILIVNWSGASNSSWIFVVDYEFASIGEGDCGTQDNLGGAPSPESVAKWLQTGEIGTTPCDWEENEPTDECCVPDSDGGYRWDHYAIGCQRGDDDAHYHSRWSCGETNDSCVDQSAHIKNYNEKGEWDGTYGCKGGKSQQSTCKNTYDIEEAYDKCYEDCGSQSNIHGTNCYNGAKGENRPDIASDICHCGGAYKSEDTSCGWRAIMNKIPYSM